MIKFFVTMMVFVISISGSINAHANDEITNRQGFYKAMGSLKSKSNREFSKVIHWLKTAPNNVEPNGTHNVGFICIAGEASAMATIQMAFCIDANYKFYRLFAIGLVGAEISGSVLIGEYCGDYKNGMRGGYNPQDPLSVNHFSLGFGPGFQFTGLSNPTGHISIAGLNLGYGISLGMLNVDIY
jgi:hypothetical protein